MRKYILALMVALLAVGTLATRANAVGAPELKLGRFGIESGLFNVIFAKELCSCLFVDGLPIDDQDELQRQLSECKAHDNLPAALHYLVSIEPVIERDAEGKAIRAIVSSKYARSLGLASRLGIRPGPSASASYDFSKPEDGCVMTSGPGL